MRVSKLIDADRRAWNKDMVDEMFIADEAIKVMAIPLSKYYMPDKLIWSDSVIGVFTVKSAYFKAREALGKIQNSYASRSPIWKIVWSARVSPKVRLFMWRLINNIIPSNGNLKGRGLQVEDVCSVCGESGESFVHLFFGCRVSMSVWNISYSKMDGIVSRDEGIEFKWEELFQHIVTDNVLEIFMVTCWLIWENRNKCFHDYR